MYNPAIKRCTDYRKTSGLTNTYAPPCCHVRIHSIYTYIQVLPNVVFLHTMAKLGKGKANAHITWKMKMRF